MATGCMVSVEASIWPGVRSRRSGWGGGGGGAGECVFGGGGVVVQSSWEVMTPGGFRKAKERGLRNTQVPEHAGFAQHVTGVKPPPPPPK